MDDWKEAFAEITENEPFESAESVADFFKMLSVLVVGVSDKLEVSTNIIIANVKLVIDNAERDGKLKNHSFYRRQCNEN